MTGGGPLTVANLFNRKGEQVERILVPNPQPDIVVYGGIYFHLQNGRYVEATLWHHHPTGIS